MFKTHHCIIFYSIVLLLQIHCKPKIIPTTPYYKSTIFEVADTLILPIIQKNRPTLRSYIDKSTGKSYITNININQKTLDFYNSDASIYKSIDLPFMKNEPVNLYYVHNFDSIFIDIDRTNYFYLINESGAILNKINVDSALNCPKDGLWEFFGARIRSNLYFYENKLYFFGLDFSRGRKGVHYAKGKYGAEENVEFILNLKNNSLVNPNRGMIQPFTYPFRKDNYPGICFSDKGILHSHSYSDYIYLFNDSVLLDSILFNSKYFVSPKSFDVNKYDDDLYNTEFFARANSYFNLYYHTIKHMYFRTSVHGFKNFINADGTKNLPLDRKWSMVISDKNFNLLEEIEFPVSTFDYCIVLPVDDGVLVSLNHELNPIFNENETKFLYLKFKN